jgi:hypothetical protein
MRIGELFDTPVAEKIEPVIKVGERGDAHKLALEISSYVVTPMIEKYLDDILEHFTDTFFVATTEIGIWLSGYFGSGKSHLAKIIALIVENLMLDGVPACKRFEARVPSDAPRRDSIKRSLGRMDQCGTQVLAFNLNTLSDSRTRPLASLLLSQYYLARGYSGNLIYARVIEAELDKQGKLPALHAAVEARAKKPWADIQKNLSFYRTYLYAAACEVAPEVFPTPQDVDQALREAERGELHNVAFLVETILADLNKREEELKKPQRLMLVLDESGQWIEDDQGRLSQLQALVEEAAIRGQGKLWLIVTTHGDMGSIYKEARALEGDMKKIEGRFRFKPALTTENIELVLEDRLFRKKLAGKQAIDVEYDSHPGVLRGLGELANTARTLTACSQEKFSVYYPFFPYQVSLIPEIVKSLRSKGGRGEQMSGSTRTLLAITQDVLRAGRRKYLDEPLGALVSFDEVYANLAGEGEITPDVRTELSRIKDMVPGATSLTPRVAEVLFLIREVPFIPRTRDNIARLLVESMDDDLPTVLARVQPELDRLIAAGLVARIGEEYEFLTGERRTFEEEVTTVEQQHKQQDRERGLAANFVHEAGKNHWRTWLGSSVVAYHDQEFPFKLRIDDTAVPGTQGAVELKVYTPLSSGLVTLDELEGRSLRPDEQYSLFFLCGRVTGFDQDLTRYLAMKEVVGNWTGDAHKSEEARELARDRETNDLPKLHRKVTDGLKAGIGTGHLIFRGSSRQVRKPDQSQKQTPADALRADMGAYWPTIYPKFDKVPVRIANDQKAICDVLAGADNPGKEVQALRLYDKAGKIDPHCPLLDSVRIYLATEQNKGRHVLGKQLLEDFAGPPTGWDPNAVRVGVAALVRAGAVKLIVSKKPYSNPADPDLVDAIRVSRNFDKAELVLEETEVEPDVLTETRKFIMKLAKKRGIDETPAALCEAAGSLATAILGKADAVHLWAGGSGMRLPADFTEGEEAWRKVVALTNPIHRVKEVHTEQETLSAGHQAIETHADFQQHSGTLFTEMVGLVGQLQAIEHRLEPGGCIPSFLSEYRTVEQSAAFADKAVWKQLQSLKAQASLELTPLLDGWRNQAHQQLQEALDRLPADMTAQGLDAALQAEMAGPLETLRDGLDAVTLPAQVAALPDRASQAIRQLGQRLADEVRKKAVAEAKKAGKEVETKPARQTRPVRIGDVVTVTRVTSEPEWEALRDKLDKRVRQLLKDYDVELG